MNKILGICVFSTLFGMAILISVIISPPHHATAQTLESILQEKSAFKNNPQIQVGPGPPYIAVDSSTNKIYVANSGSDTVSVIDSNSGNVTSTIHVGLHPSYITVNWFTNKIYVANSDSNTISVIDEETDKKTTTDIPVGQDPEYIAVNPSSALTNKIYVANSGSNTVSVINGSNDKKEPNDIPVGQYPFKIAVDGNAGRVYVANSGSNTISVIDEETDKKTTTDIPVGQDPASIDVDSVRQIIYVTNYDSNTVTVINGTNYKKATDDIPVGQGPYNIAVGGELNRSKIYVANSVSNTVSVINGTNYKKTTNDIPLGQNIANVALIPEIAVGRNKIYVANSGSNTVSVINGSNDKKEPNDIPVGQYPFKIAANPTTNIIYVTNNQFGTGPSTVSVIDGSVDRVVAGITFHVSPANSGNIFCNNNNKAYPTNTYLYVESGRECYAKANNDFEFSSWVQNLGHNSTITLNVTSISDSSWNSFLRLIGRAPNDPSVTFDVNGYGSFTANFKPLPPAVPAEYWASLFTVVATALVGSLLIPAGIGWFKSKRQTSRLNSYHKEINLYGKGNTQQLNKSYNMIINAYSEGKINNEQYTNLKTEISILYEEIYKKRIDLLNGNGIPLDEVQDDIRDAYAKGKLIEQHYKLLNEKISDSKNYQGSASKISSRAASASTKQGSPIKANK